LKELANSFRPRRRLPGLIRRIAATLPVGELGEVPATFPGA
jgi:hypothetical protein